MSQSSSLMRKPGHGASQSLEHACLKAVRVHWLHPEAPHVRLSSRAFRPAEGHDVVGIVEAEWIPRRVVHALLCGHQRNSSSIGHRLGTDNLHVLLVLLGSGPCCYGRCIRQRTRADT